MKNENAAVKTEFRDGILTAYINGEIDHHTCKKIREIIDFSLTETSPDKLVLDLSMVSFMDSSGLGLVMGRFRKTQSAKIDMAVTGTPPRPAQMFSMAGLERLIKFE